MSTTRGSNDFLSDFEVTNIASAAPPSGFAASVNKNHGIGQI